jgi:hypothetical protein
MAVASYSAIGVGALLLVHAYRSHQLTTSTAGSLLPFHPISSLLHHAQPRTDHSMHG